MTSRPHRLIGIVASGVLLAGSLVAAGTGAAVADAGDGTIDVLVLGDSYSAGNGATDDQGNAQTYGPADCYRSKVDWAEKYAATLRAAGQRVRVVNHACSGGVTADFTHPRVMDTQSKFALGASDAEALFRTDPCNTHAFPDEEFWTYQATSVSAAGTAYTCTRNLRPQVDFVNPGVDLVLFTMGGNDAGFTTIVTGCFIERSPSACKTAVDAARGLLPQIRQRLVDGIAAIRAHGLRDDAKMVQLGYPWLQQDNDYTVTDGSTTYPAGDEVRSLVSEGDAAIGGIVPDVNAGHPGQLSFLAGVPEKFSGHEPDATTPVGNPARWINQVGDGTNTSLYYHPNRFGQTAYAELLATHGTFGAPDTAGATMRVRASHHPRVGHRVRLRVTVRLLTGARPRGTVVVTALPSGRRLAATKVRLRDHGVVRLSLRVRGARTTAIRIVYRDRTGATAVRERGARPAR